MKTGLLLNASQSTVLDKGDLNNLLASGVKLALALLLGY